MRWPSRRRRVRSSAAAAQSGSSRSCCRRRARPLRRSRCPRALASAPPRTCRRASHRPRRSPGRAAAAGRTRCPRLSPTAGTSAW
ncbi:hypothetical protein C5C34_13815 [Rathayibacter rathayi]|nr:hypothetical protein C5C34_13815 [Rathayibacter rathayi]PPG92398.1 hypothetical protein C5C22_12940 [Rathayibacter rathayi]